MEFLIAEEVRERRPALTVTQRRAVCGRKEEKRKGPCERISSCAQECCRCGSGRAWAAVTAKAPILAWLPRYDLKGHLVADTIAGITVAVMHIPQGMAYALLAGLPPIVGLYMAFFPVLIYVLLGTSPHISIGTSAVVCILMEQVVGELSSDVETETLVPLEGSPVSAVNGTIPLYSPQEVAAAISLVVGLWQILLGVLQLGEIFGRFLSDMLISGFTTGVAVKVLTSQVKYLVGVSVPRYSGAFSIIYTYTDIISHLLSANIAVMVISGITLVILVATNQFIKPRVKKVTKLPVPIELAVVVVGTAMSYFLNFSERYNVLIVGDIPTGLPAPSPPPVVLLPRLAVRGFVIGLVGYTSSMSMAKVFAKQKGYLVDATQELYAQGAGCILGSFFSCGPIAASLSRSLIQEAVGGATLVTSFISCLFILLILFFVGPLFENLPNCVLAAIIAVSLKGMLVQFRDVAPLWRVSKLDALIWLSTFVTVVIVDIDFGLLAGIAASVAVLIVRSHKTTITRLGRVPGTDIFLPCDLYEKAEEMPGVRLLGVCGPLHFANIAFLREQLEPGSPLVLPVPKRHETLYSITANTMSAESTICDFSILSELKNPKDDEANEDESIARRGRTKDDAELLYLPTTSCSLSAMTVVLDLSNVGFVDSSGAKFLKDLHDDLREASIVLCLAAPSEKVLEQLEVSGTLKAFPKEQVFHSGQDAVAILTQGRTAAPSLARTPDAETSLASV